MASREEIICLVPGEETTERSSKQFRLVSNRQSSKAIYIRDYWREDVWEQTTQSKSCDQSLLRFAILGSIFEKDVWHPRSGFWCNLTNIFRLPHRSFQRAPNSSRSLPPTDWKAVHIPTSNTDWIKQRSLGKIIYRDWFPFRTVKRRFNHRIRCFSSGKLANQATYENETILKPFEHDKEVHLSYCKPKMCWWTDSKDITETNLLGQSGLEKRMPREWDY